MGRVYWRTFLRISTVLVALPLAGVLLNFALYYLFGYDADLIQVLIAAYFVLPAFLFGTLFTIDIGAAPNTLAAWPAAFGVWLVVSLVISLPPAILSRWRG